MELMEHVKKLMPRTSTDMFAFGVMMALINAVSLFELVFILPSIDPDYKYQFYLLLMIGLMIYSNLNLCIYKTIATDITSGSIILPSILKPGWRYCPSCESNAPPRSFHCWDCSACVLKRDHHCIFAGKCIGFANYRYFLSMLTWLMIGSFYCTFLNIDHIWEMFGGLSLRSLVTMLMPLLSWVVGIAREFSFLLAFLSGICLIGSLTLIGFLTFHLINLKNGQTTYERGRSIKEYDFGWKENARQAMGENWYVAWISPLIPSKTVCDGINFRSISENIKTL